MTRFTWSTSLVTALALIACDSGESGGDMPGDAGSDSGMSTDAGSDSGMSMDAGGDGGGPNQACDPLTQRGCQLDEKCSARLAAAGFTGVATECLPDGTQAIGEPCEIAVDPDDPNMTRFDNCGAGGFCFDDGLCRELCDPEILGGCADFADTPQVCLQFSGIFDDSGGGNSVGICDPQCDPFDDTTCEPGEGCYGLLFRNEFICAVPAMGAEGLTAWQDCEPVDMDGACFINSGPPGATVFYPLDWTVQAARGVVSPWCAPISTHSLVPDRLTTRHGNSAIRACGLANLQSVSDFGAGETRPGECRFAQSIFANEEFGLLPETIGVCVNPADGPNWKLSADFDLAALGEDPTNPSLQCPGCVTRAELEQALEAANGGSGTQARTGSFSRLKQYHLSEAGLRRFELMMGVTFDELRKAKERGQPIEIPGFGDQP